MFCALDAASWDLVCAPELWTCDLLLNTGPSPATASPQGLQRRMLWDLPGDGSRGPTALHARRIAPDQGQSCGPGPGVVLKQGGGTQRPLRCCSQHQRCLVFGIKDVLAEVCTACLSAGRGSHQGHAVGVEEPSVAGGEGQHGTAPVGRHSQSMSSKQGKLIPGPSTLLMGVQTTPQLEPGTAVRASRAGHCGKGLNTAQAGRQWQGYRQSFLAAQGEGGGCPGWGAARTWGGRGSSPAPVGASRAWGEHNHPSTGDTPQRCWHPWLDGLTGTCSSWAAHRGEIKKEMQTSSFTGSVPLL